jgi:Coenzyme PQQ synthesis protein D (PqqD)
MKLGSTLSARVAVPVTVLFRDLDGEGVILDTRSGRYFGLNEVGTRMWLLLHEHGQVEAAYKDLSAEYKIDQEELARDLLEFVSDLKERRLLEVS